MLPDKIVIGIRKTRGWPETFCRRPKRAGHIADEAPSISGLNLAQGEVVELFHFQCDHLCGNVLLREILRDFAQDVVVALISQICGDQFIGVGPGSVFGQTELRSGPITQHLVAPCRRLEPYLLIVDKFVFKACSRLSKVVMIEVLFGNALTSV
ncbi:hypothetical protein [Nitrobacter hamburgensis]|uniref:hypothetical protein n=1 Tax=Nitrobacter hamburgensis TaxID=912 RepID=UPI003D31883C